MNTEIGADGLPDCEGWTCQSCGSDNFIPSGFIRIYPPVSTDAEADITCRWHGDPYDQPVQIQGHMHAEPVCAWPDCQTYLTRDDMRILHLRAMSLSPERMQP